MGLPDLDLLVAIVDAGSLAGAAERLNMPRATVSRRLARLEDDMGAVLVHRTTRTLTPTDAGMTLYRHARPIVDAVDTAKAAVRSQDGEPQGLLRVTLPPASDLTFAEILNDYLRDYPRVRIEVVAVTRHVDLVSEGFDVGVRGGQLTGSALMSRRLTRIHTVLVASPAYLMRRGVPDSPQDLSEHDALVGFARGEVPVRAWPLTAGGTVDVTPRLASNDLRILVQAAVHGQGLALLPHVFVRDELQSGALVQVLPHHIGNESGVWVVYPEKRLMLPRVRLFIDRLVTWFEEHPLGTRRVL